MRKARPKGRCVLCGKPVWGRAEPFENGVKHPECVPKAGPGTYGRAQDRKG